MPVLPDVDQHEGPLARFVDRFPLGLPFCCQPARPQRDQEPSEARPFGLRFLRPWSIEPISPDDYRYDDASQIGIGPRAPRMSKYPKITYTQNNTDTTYDPDPEEAD